MCRGRRTVTSPAQHLSSCQRDLHPLPELWNVRNNVELSYNWLANDPQRCITGVTLEPAAKSCRHGNEASEVLRRLLAEKDRRERHVFFCVPVCMQLCIQDLTSDLCYVFKSLPGLLFQSAFWGFVSTCGWRGCTSLLFLSCHFCLCAFNRATDVKTKRQKEQAMLTGLYFKLNAAMLMTVLTMLKFRRFIVLYAHQLSFVSSHANICLLALNIKYNWGCQMQTDVQS